jgi:hypothetical protein
MAVGGGVIGAGGAVLGAGFHGVETVGKVGVYGVGKGVGTAAKGVGNVGKFGVKGVGFVRKGVFSGAKRLTGHARTKSGEVVPIALDSEGRPILDAGGNPLVVDQSGSIIGSAEGLETLVEGPGGGGGGSNITSVNPEGTLRIQVGTLNGVGDEGEKKAVQIKLNGGKTILETHSHKGDGNGITFSDSTTVKSDGGPLELEVSVV